MLPRPFEVVPIYTTSGELLRWVERGAFEQHEARFNVKRNRRGNVTRAYEKPLLSLDVRPNSTLGVAFEQHFKCGLVMWALRGVEGSR